MANCVSNMAAQLARERRHPANDDGGLDPIIQRSEVTRPQAAHGQTHATDAFLVHFWPREQVIHGADIIPEHHTRPRKARRVNRAPDELLALARAPVEL